MSILTTGGHSLQTVIALWLIILIGLMYRRLRLPNQSTSRHPDGLQLLIVLS